MIGQVIMRVRKERNMTRRELAEKVGKSVSFTSLLERGCRNPSMTTIVEYAKALNIPLPVLVHAAYPDYSLECKDQMDKLALDNPGFVLHND